MMTNLYVKRTGNNIDAAFFVMPIPSQSKRH